ncbi:MAG TPA: hypothetical protein VI230_05745, partial [Ignavibacteriaceae bacterium]
FPNPYFTNEVYFEIPYIWLDHALTKCQSPSFFVSSCNHLSGDLSRSSPVYLPCHSASISIDESSAKMADFKFYW